MFGLVCKHCGVPIEYYKNRESTFGCQINVIEGYGYNVGRHEYKYEFIILFNKLFCSKENKLE